MRNPESAGVIWQSTKMRLFMPVRLVDQASRYSCSLHPITSLGPTSKFGAQGDEKWALSKGSSYSDLSDELSYIYLHRRDRKLNYMANVSTCPKQ